MTSRTTALFCRGITVTFAVKSGFWLSHGARSAPYGAEGTIPAPQALVLSAVGALLRAAGTLGRRRRSLKMGKMTFHAIFG